MMILKNCVILFLIIPKLFSYSFLFLDTFLFNNFKKNLFIKIFFRLIKSWLFLSLSFIYSFEIKRSGMQSAQKRCAPGVF